MLQSPYALQASHAALDLADLPEPAAPPLTQRARAYVERVQPLVSARIAHAPSLIERVRVAVAALGCEGVWARGSGHYVLLGLHGEDAYARIAAHGSVAFTLAFRNVAHTDSGAVSGLAWEPLLVDDLRAVVEHALIAVDALAEDALSGE